MVRYERAGVRRYSRADATFAKPEVYEYLEEHSFPYAIRLPSNQVPERKVQHLMKRPVVWYHDVKYQAKTWDQSRRVVAKSLP